MRGIYCLLRIPRAKRKVKVSGRTEMLPALPLKIKVGKINSELEALGIKSIRAAVGPDIRIRLDANRSWNLDEAVQFGKTLRAANIEYIEEPLQRPADLPIFHNECGMHFAFDETLHHILDPGISFQSYTGLSALVIKPSLVACMPRILELIRRARQENIKLVISSSFESDVGISNLAQLAAGISDQKTAMGLDTNALFSRHLSNTTVPEQNGWLKVQSFDQQALDLDSCELVFEKHV